MRNTLLVGKTPARDQRHDGELVVFPQQTIQFHPCRKADADAGSICSHAGGEHKKGARSPEICDGGSSLGEISSARVLPSAQSGLRSWTCPGLADGLIRLGCVRS